MREHEVPTHVQAEDRVLLWFTFPQIVAITAVCALSYGAYRYAPVGPSEVRIGIAVLFGLIGLAAVVGKIGGRRLPLVAADLLKYRLGARLYAGPLSQLVRSESPAPVQPTRSGPSPLRLMAKKAGRTLRSLRPRRKSREKTGGRMPFRPHRWFGKPKKAEADKDSINDKGKDRRRKRPRRFLPVMVGLALVAAVATIPHSALADGHEPWHDEIDFEIEEPVEGRRIYVEGLTVSGDRAVLTVKAATDLEIRVRAFGGSEGNSLRFWGEASLAQGESIDYNLPLHGPVPSLTVSWEDTLNQAGAMTVEHDRLPHPLPEVEGDLCTVRLKSLGWAPGAVHGIVESECVASVEHPVELQTVAGHESVTQTALIQAGVTQITGTVNAVYGGTSAGVAFVPNAEMSFTLAVPDGAAIHDVSVDASVAADLSVPIPPLTVLTHHPERTEDITETVSLYRPGASDSDSDSQSITVTHEDGTTTEHTVSAYAYAHVPARTIQKDVTITVVHPEHVKAEVVERDPVAGSRDESLDFASYIGSDDLYEALVLPEPEPEAPPAEQTLAGGLRGWFDLLGWEWPW